MVATESQIMLNIIADPVTMSVVGEKHARVRSDVARISTLVAEVANHIYRLTKMKAHDRILSILLQNTADAGLSDVNIGIWTPSLTDADPVVVDADGLCDGFDMSSAQLTPLEILGTGTGAGDPADYGRPLWEFCPGGPATDPGPGLEYEICAEAVIGNPAGSGDYAFMITYTAGD